MPNWAKGYLRVKGKVNDICNFIENELCYIGEVLREEYRIMERPIKLEIYGEELYIPVSKEVFGDDAERVCYPRIYVKGTKRNFIEKTLDMCVAGMDKTDTVVFAGYKAAWGVEAKPYVNISKKYNLEIKIDVYERGMCFSQHIHIVNGQLMQDEERKYDDWKWDCPCPDFGG